MKPFFNNIFEFFVQKQNHIHEKIYVDACMYVTLFKKKKKKKKELEKKMQDYQQRK